ncbi:hypothetical protein B484DRAFT_449231 [Ochromonadaceae sp. CCMP2298]|nr:hypothetical protein B484DRAFT_449231 [Ochromonadaceae sp. CCMP2298]
MATNAFAGLRSPLFLAQLLLSFPVFLALSLLLVLLVVPIPLALGLHLSFPVTAIYLIAFVFLILLALRVLLVLLVIFLPLPLPVAIFVAVRVVGALLLDWFRSSHVLHSYRFHLCSSLAHHTPGLVALSNHCVVPIPRFCCIVSHRRARLQLLARRLAWQQALYLGKLSPLPV